MEYSELYKKFQTAIKIRDLSADDNYNVLKEIFHQKILDSINLNTQSNLIPYLAGIRDVFSFVKTEAEKLDSYRDELDEALKER